MPEKGD